MQFLGNVNQGCQLSHHFLTMFASRLSVDTAFSFSSTASSGSFISSSFVSAFFQRSHSLIFSLLTDASFDIQHFFFVSFCHKAHSNTTAPRSRRASNTVRVLFGLQ